MLLAHPRANAWQPGPAAEFWEMLSQLALDQPQRYLLTRAAAAEKDANSYPPAKAQNPPTPAILFEPEENSPCCYPLVCLPPGSPTGGVDRKPTSMGS